MSKQHEALITQLHVVESLLQLPRHPADVPIPCRHHHGDERRAAQGHARASGAHRANGAQQEPVRTTMHQ